MAILWAAVMKNILANFGAIVMNKYCEFWGFYACRHMEEGLQLQNPP